MTTIMMIGWKKGLLTVSLIVMHYSTVASLGDAKDEVERLIGGELVTLRFASEVQRDEFQRLAEPMGAIFAS